MGPEFRSSSARWLQVSNTQRVVARISVGSLASEGLPGAGRTAPSHRGSVTQRVSQCWLLTGSRGPLPLGCLSAECPYNTTAGFPQRVPYNLLSEVAHHHVCKSHRSHHHVCKSHWLHHHICKSHWLHRSALFTRKWTTQGHESLLPGDKNDIFESAFKGGPL